MSARYDLQKSKSDTQFYWNLKAGNNEKILTSQMYASKEGALTGIASCHTNSPDDTKFERKSGDGGPYFVLKAANGEIIGKSESYSSASAMETGIASVKANGKAPTEDNS